MRFEEYLILESEDVTFDQYCQAIDCSFGVEEGIFGDIKDRAIGILAKAFDHVKKDIARISEDFGIGIAEILAALKTKNMFNLLKAIGFNIMKLFKAVESFTGWIRDGLLHVFTQIYKTGAFQKIRSGAMKIDELLQKYPILGKVAGIGVAGLLFWIWLNMTFIGNMDYDFDFTNIARALAGKFSLADTFFSPEGLLLMTLLGTGSILSAPWLGKAAYNLVLAIVFTSMKHAKGSDVPQKIIASIRQKVPFGKI